MIDGLIENDKMNEYYKNIKFIVQNSYYESCSNVVIEGIFNGCIIDNTITNIKKMEEIIIDFSNYFKVFKLKKNTNYIFMRNGTKYNNFTTSSIYYNKLYLSKGLYANELVVYCCFNKDIEVNLLELIYKSNVSYKYKSKNNNILEDKEIIGLYYIAGYCNLNKLFMNLEMFYDDYVRLIKKKINKKRLYNKKILLKVYGYYKGKKKETLKRIKFNTLLKNYNILLEQNKNLFHNKKCLFISKKIKSIGGNQKSGLEIIYELDHYYEVYFLNFSKSSVNDLIMRNFIINCSLEDLNEYLKTNKFGIVFINKLNNFFNYISNIDAKFYVLTHNSMDPFNRYILDYEHKIEKVFTVNEFHINLLKKNGYKGKVLKYYNKIKEDKITSRRKKFNNKIVFVGRISSEKYVKILIKAFNMLLKKNKNLKLYLIGSMKCDISKKLNNNIIRTGELNFDKVNEHLDTADYLVLPSITEGFPFVLLEALNRGIPCICSNINGVNEVIKENINGFLFNLSNYDKFKNIIDNWSAIDYYQNNFQDNVKNLHNTLLKAYSINILEWNEMSKRCYNLMKTEYNYYTLLNNNLRNFGFDVKKKIFINFKPKVNLPYGGGNLNTYYLINYLESFYNITYDLEADCSYFIIIDVLKDNNFKKYNLEEVIDFRDNYCIRGKIILRVNDCDITRIIINKNVSREHHIKMNCDKIDGFIFNSEFIKNYYFNKYRYFKKNKKSLVYNVINNGVDLNMFDVNKVVKNKKIRIVTHHWSPNLNKGYKIYYDLWKYCQKSDKYDFVFIGKNVPDLFKKVKIEGPYSCNELAKQLNKYDIYISASIYDSCPNHILEAFSCGLPILYLDHEGGVKELSEKYKNVSLPFKNFDDLKIKLDEMSKNVSSYRNNVLKIRDNFNYIKSCENYLNFFENYSNKFIFEQKIRKSEDYVIKVTNKNHINFRLIIKGSTYFLGKGEFLFFMKLKRHDNIVIKSDLKIDIEIMKRKLHFKKLNNKMKLNLLLCSDKNYFVGLFACLKSFIDNYHDRFNVNYNFIIKREDINNFNLLINKFEDKIKNNLSKTIIIIDNDFIDKSIFETNCYNGGNHLLNISNFSRLLIGEFFNYKKLLYLDSDFEKQIVNFKVEYPIYAFKCNFKGDGRKSSIILPISRIINCKYNFEKLIGTKINPDDYAFMGAPFIADCSQWGNVYSKIIEIIKEHNRVEGGLYSLFTMSLQNIIFYNKTGDLKSIILSLPDLGSVRKEWTENLLNKAKILDWSGMYKPWFKNGLNKKYWDKYDIMNLSKNYDFLIEKNKNTIESFSSNNLLWDIDYPKINKDYKNEINSYLENILNLSENRKYYESLIKNIKYDIKKKSSKKKILYFCSLNYLIRKMSRVRFWAIESLANNDDIDLYFTGPGFSHYDCNISLQDNIYKMNIDFDYVIWYKPLDDEIKFKKGKKLKFKTILRYNEMWDTGWTMKEIKDSMTDIVICHHKNDQIKYEKNIKDKFFYNPHFTNQDIFYDKKVNRDIDILISGVCKENHYPLKKKLYDLIKKNKKSRLKKYNIVFYDHPGYWHDNSFVNFNQIEYANILNRSKICIACSSKYKYRLGKYIEIPLCGGIILGDVPDDDYENIKKFIIEINEKMTDNSILNIIEDSLNNSNVLNTKRIIGQNWAKRYNKKNYVKKFLDILNYNEKKKKIFIIADEIRDNHPEFGNKKWICDNLKQEFKKEFDYYVTDNPEEAKIIWYIAPWNNRFIPPNISIDKWNRILKDKQVIFTMHHLDKEKFKLGIYDKQFEFMKKYGYKYHAICQKTFNDLLELKHNIDIEKEYLWVDESNFYNISKNKNSIRKKFNINLNSYLIGSFQKDTEGDRKNGIKPKLSKGPDLFIEIIKDLLVEKKNVEVVLTGLRREYIIDELKKLGVKYYYFNMVSLDDINLLYNCLDLYIVSSRFEGGPRSIVECGFTKTPIISTDVGIASEFLSSKSIFDMNNIKSYKNSKHDIEFLSNSTHNLRIELQSYNIKKMLLK